MLATVLVIRSLFDLGDCWSLRFSHCQVPERFDSLKLSSLSLSLLSRVFHSSAAASDNLKRVVSNTTASHVVSSPSTFSQQWVATLSQDYHILSCAFSVFHTLSRLYSTHYLSALFHADPVHGVQPFRVNLRPESDPSFRISLPS